MISPRPRTRLPSVLGLLIGFAQISSAAAQPSEDPRRTALTELNLTPPFLVRVDVDRADRIYHGGDTLQVSVRSERDGFLYLFYCDASGQVSCLYPNQVQSESRITANQTIIIPAADAPFRLRVGPPYGSEVLKAVVTTEPLQSLEIEALTKGGFATLQPQNLKAVFVEVKERAAAPSAGRPRGREWAEHHLQIVTAAPNQTAPETPNLSQLPPVAEFVQPPARPAAQPPTQPATQPPAQPPASAPPTTPPPESRTRPKRIGVFIGISRYRDAAIRPLRVADQDAQAMAQTLQTLGQLDESVLLVNETATLTNIQRVIQSGLPAATSPGDLILIYWSGHGGRTSNLDGTEPDGFDEYLIPYDGRLEPVATVRQTMLLDKTFGRWTQSLDGRRLVVILDACHSGGQTQGAIKALTGGQPTAPFRDFFFANAFARTKDLGQRETAVLASSRASQISFEQRGQQLSVMTHFLVERIRTSTAPLALQEAAAYVVEKVPPFVERHYPGTTQTPVFVDYTTAPVLLRP